MRAGPLLTTAGAAALAALAAVLAGCGSDGGSSTSSSATAPTAPQTATGVAQGKLPQGAEGPTDTAEEAAEGRAATEASPEASANGPKTGDLSGIDEEAVTQTVRFYVDALDRHDAALVCELIEPGGLRVSELPVRRGGCATSLGASIGYRRGGSVPAWRRTKIVEITAVSIGGGGARVTATVTHKFADRGYTSVEEDVIYLEPHGARWLLAKPSGTLYRAVGYPEPPLRALEPPG